MTEPTIDENGNLRIHLEEIVVPGKPLGRHVNWDPKSKQFKVAVQPARTLRNVRHTRRVGVFNQGALGSCTGNASVGAVGTNPLYDTLPAGHPELDQPLAVKVYARATEIDPFSGIYPPTDTGSDGLSVAKACKELGLISGYLHATSLAAMQSALQDTPVIVGVAWYEGFDSPDSAGRVKLGGQERGGHEFEVVGLDLERQEFEAINSWGLGYGVDGHFYFSFADMDRLLHEYGDSTQLLPLSVPAPVPTPLTDLSVEEMVFVDVYTSWRKGIFSKFSKAGKLKAAGDRMLTSWGRL